LTQPAWLEDGWEPSPQWCDADRIELASALLELIERDVYAGRYSLPGRPNFTSVQAVLHEVPGRLEVARPSAVAMLRTARAERRGS
jgi:hypothetical protein